MEDGDVGDEIICYELINIIVLVCICNFSIAIGAFLKVLDSLGSIFLDYFHNFPTSNILNSVYHF